MIRVQRIKNCQLANLRNQYFDFTNKFVNNRVLDLYLKILGVTTLTPTTLVPIALIYGQKAFMKYIKYLTYLGFYYQDLYPVVTSPL